MTNTNFYEDNKKQVNSAIKKMAAYQYMMRVSND